MDETQRLAVEQFANIEMIKFMTLDLWGYYLLEQNDPLVRANKIRARHLQLLQEALDDVPDSIVRSALLDQAEANWDQILQHIQTGSHQATSM